MLLELYKLCGNFSVGLVGNTVLFRKVTTVDNVIATFFFNDIIILNKLSLNLSSHFNLNFTNFENWSAIIGENKKKNTTWWFVACFILFGMALIGENVRDWDLKADLWVTSAHFWEIKYETSAFSIQANIISSLDLNLGFPLGNPGC